MDISDTELRSRLAKFGYEIGGITDTTRPLYLSKLKDFETGKPSPKRGGRKSLDRSQKVGRKSVQNTTIQESTDSPSTRTRRKSLRDAPVPKSSTVADGNESLTDKELKKELSKYGVDVGPIDGTTRGLYTMKLERLQKGLDSKPKKTTPEIRKKSTLPKKYVDESSEYDEVESEDEHPVAKPVFKNLDSNGKSNMPLPSSYGDYSFLDTSDTDLIASKVNRSFGKFDPSSNLVKGRRSIGVPAKPKTPTRRSMGNFSTPTATRKPTPTANQSFSRDRGLEGFSDSDGEILPGSRNNYGTTGINRYILRNRADRPLGTETLDEVDAAQNEQWEQWMHEVISVIRRKSQWVITVSIFFLILLFGLYYSTKSNDKILSLNRSIRNDESVICKGDEQKLDCVKQNNVEKALQLLDPLRSVLEEYSDAYFCGTPDVSSPRMPVDDAIHSLSTYLRLSEADVKSRMRDLVVLIMHYPHWSIDYGFDDYQVGSGRNPDHVRWLAIKDPSPPLVCWLMSFTSIALRGFALIVAVVTVVIGVVYGLWLLWKSRKSKEAQITTVIDRVIAILKAQKSKDPHNPYMPVSMIQSKVYTDLNERVANKKLWNEVVDVVDQQEGMIASGRTNINGVEHVVWCWQGETLD